MNVREARIVGDQVKCWHCTYTLGQIVNGLEEPRVLAAQPFYRQAAIPAAFAEAGIRSVLVIAPRARDNLARGRLDWRRRKSMDSDGGVRVRPPVIARMPALMPCFQPGCGEPNRVIDTGITTN